MIGLRNIYSLTMSETAIDYCSEISAMRVRMDEMHGIMQKVLAFVDGPDAAPRKTKGRPQYEDYYLDDVERNYLVTCKELQLIWMVCERTAYRYIKKYSLTDVGDGGTGQFRLGDVTDAISTYGIHHTDLSATSRLSNSFQLFREPSGIALIVSLKACVPLFSFVAIAVGFRGLPVSFFLFRWD